MMRHPFVLQALGWTLVAGLDLALNRAAHPSEDFLWAMYAALALGLSGLSVSSALLWIYRARLPPRGAALAAAVALGTLAGAAAWYLLLYGLDRAVGYPFSEPLGVGLFGRGMLCFFILLAWHGALLALRASARAASAERLAQEARLTALRYQLNPHFLFNVLNSAIALIDEDPERAQTMLTMLSGLLRQTLYGDTDGETTLEEELDVISRYVEIQRVRFEDSLRVELEIADAARRCTIPPLLLHALVDNSVKHGMRTSEAMPLRVRLAATYDGDALRLEVSNTGTLAPREDRDGVGLRNVADRLNALYPGRHRFEMIEQEGAVRATVEIQSPKVIA